MHSGKSEDLGFDAESSHHALPSRISLVLSKVAMSWAIPIVCSAALVTDLSGLLAITSLFTSE